MMIHSGNTVAETQLSEANLEHIPQAMRDTPTWLGWRWGEKPNGGRTKVPVRADGRGSASSTNPATWCGFADAVKAWRAGTVHGLGFVTTAEHGFCACDLDDCLDASTGVIAPWAAAIVERFNSYTEVSPSGTGLHIFMRASLPKGKGIGTGFGDGGGLYSQGRYMTVTGQHFPGTPRVVEDRQAVVDAIIAERQPVKSTARVVTVSNDSTLADAEVLHRLRSAKNGEKFIQLWSGEWENYDYESQSNADLGLLCIMAYHTRDADQLERLFSESVLGQREKWQDRDDYRERTIEKALELTEEDYNARHDGNGADQPMRADTNAAASQQRKVGRRLDTIQPERVAWLWPGRIPYGKLTVLDGDPGLGKSTVTMDIAARLTTGQPLPDGEETEAAGVVLLTAEDGMADTVVPRLQAAGANLSRIIDASTQDNGERLARLNDLTWLEDNINEVAAKLVIIDPLMAFLGDKVNSYNDQEIRGALGPLAKLGERTGAAIVVVRHLNKGKGNSAIYRGGGSIGIIGAARSGLLVAKEPNNPEWRVLASVKSNLGPPPASLAYRLESTDNGSSRVEWLGTVNYDADALLAPAEGERPQGERDKAASFLTTALKDGPAYSRELQARVKDVGISDRTYWRAADELRLETWKEAGVQRGRTLTGLPGQRELYRAAANAATSHDASYITTVAECGIPYPNHLNHTLPHGNVGRVKDSNPPVVMVHTLPTLPSIESGTVDNTPPRRIVYCDNALTAAEMAMEGAWEESLNSRYHHYDATTGAWPVLTAH